MQLIEQMAETARYVEGLEAKVASQDECTSPLVADGSPGGPR